MLLFLFDKCDCSIVWQLATFFSSKFFIQILVLFDFQTFFFPSGDEPLPCIPPSWSNPQPSFYPLSSQTLPSSPHHHPNYLSSLCMVMASVLFSSSIILQPEGCMGRVPVVEGRCGPRLPYCSWCWIWDGRTVWWCWAPPCWPLFWAA